MITNLKPYPAYKDSGVPWLGKVPEHWDVVPNRALMKLKKQVVNERADDYTLLSLTKRGIIARDMEKPEGKFPTSFETYQVVEPGNLIFCLFDIDETPRAVGLSSLNGMITGAYTRFVCPDEQARRFIYLLYLSLDNGKLLKPLYSGLRKVITKSTFLSAKLALPPAPEQTAIVRFLDWADRRIRRVIRLRNQRIKLLEEYKQALIHQAVTGQIDVRTGKPYPKYKHSGVEWLGEVPEHWKVRRLKQLGDVRIGLTYSPGDVIGDSGKLVLRASNIRDGRIVNADNVYVSKDIPSSLLLQKGDVLICVRSGSRNLVGKSGIVSRQFADNTFGAFMTRFRSKNNEGNKYVYWVLNSNLLPSVMAQFETSTINQLTQDNLRNLFIPLPPLSEQTAIVEFLDEQTARIDAAIAADRRVIDLLEEFRTRLIADVVTGKIDVREAAAKLPDERPEDEAETLEDVETDEGDEMADEAGLDALSEESFS